MMLRTSIWTLFLLMASATAFAADQAAPDLPPPPQATVPEQAPPPPAKRPGTAQPATPPAPPVAIIEAARRPRGRDHNLQIELTISDQSGTQAPEKKVVSMLVAESTMGRIRASADAQRSGVGMVGTGLNVDARPSVIEGDRILLELTVEYSPLREGTQVAQRPTVLHESLSVILQNGKSIIVSQAADPVSDRKMTVEVRASIVK